jgi:hypothetical protein
LKKPLKLKLFLIQMRRTSTLMLSNVLRNGKIMVKMLNLLS